MRNGLKWPWFTPPDLPSICGMLSLSFSSPMSGCEFDCVSRSSSAPARARCLSSSSPLWLCAYQGACGIFMRVPSTPWLAEW